MTKELQELFSTAGSKISQLGRYNGNDNESQARSSLRAIESYLNEFFNSNVCIHKGVNRHPSSDVLHQAIEGIKIQGWNHTNNVWEDDTSWFIDKNDLDYPTKYRIKPAEPVYEWQWMYKFKNGNKFHFTGYETEDEMNHFMSTLDNDSIGHYATKIEETKRERK